MFETVPAGHPVSRRSPLAGPLSIALHAAVLGAIVVGSAWRISDPGEPNVPLVFLTANPPGPPGPAAAAKGPDRPRERGVRAASALVPIAVPSTIPTRVDSAPDVGPVDLGPADAGASPGGGSPDGVEGGAGDLPFSGTGPAAPISAAAPDVVPPRLLSQAQPEYPESARKARLQGMVLLQAVIGTSGLVEDVRVVSSSSSLFEEAAIRAVRQWRYAPATLARRAVRVYLTVTMNFTLH